MVLMSASRRGSARKTEIGVGTRVWSNAFDDGKRWYPGVVASVNGNGVVVTFDHGNESIQLSRWSVKTDRPREAVDPEAPAATETLVPFSKKRVLQSQAAEKKNKPSPQKTDDKDDDLKTDDDEASIEEQEQPPAKKSKREDSSPTKPKKKEATDRKKKNPQKRSHTTTKKKKKDEQHRDPVPPSLVEEEELEDAPPRPRRKTTEATSTSASSPPPAAVGDEEQEFEFAPSPRPRETYDQIKSRIQKKVRDRIREVAETKQDAARVPRAEPKQDAARLPRAEPRPLLEAAPYNAIPPHVANAVPPARPPREEHTEVPPARPPREQRQVPPGEVAVPGSAQRPPRDSQRQSREPPKRDGAQTAQIRQREPRRDGDQTTTPREATKEPPARVARESTNVAPAAPPRQQQKLTSAADPRRREKQGPRAAVPAAASVRAPALPAAASVRATAAPAAAAVRAPAVPAAASVRATAAPAAPPRQQRQHQAGPESARPPQSARRPMADANQGTTQQRQPRTSKEEEVPKSTKAATTTTLPKPPPARSEEAKPPPPPPAAPKQQGSSSTNGGGGGGHEVFDLTGDEVTTYFVEAEQPTESEAREAPQLSLGKDAVVMTGSTMAQALVEYPHSRKDCARFPMSQDPAKFCGNCYCYVCDVKASECRSWRAHCVAMPEVKLWRIERILAQNRPPRCAWQIGRCLEVVSDVVTTEATAWRAPEYMPLGDKRQWQIFGRMLGRERTYTTAGEVHGRRTVEGANGRRSLVTGGWIVLHDPAIPGVAGGVPFSLVTTPVATLIRVCRMPEPPRKSWEDFLHAVVANARGGWTQSGGGGRNGAGGHHQNGGSRGLTTTKSFHTPPAAAAALSPPASRQTLAQEQTSTRKTLVDLTATVIVTDDVAAWKAALVKQLGAAAQVLVLEDRRGLVQQLVQGYVDLRRVEVLLSSPENVLRNREIFDLCAFHRVVLDRPARVSAFAAGRVARGFHVWLVAPFEPPRGLATYEDHFRFLGAWESRVDKSTLANDDGPRSFRAFSDYAATLERRDDDNATRTLTFAGDDHSTLARLFHAWFFRYKHPTPARSPMQLQALVGTGPPPTTAPPGPRGPRDNAPTTNRGR